MLGFHNEDLAERMGVLARDFANRNEINGFAIISRNRNDLASSNLRQRFVRLPALPVFLIQ